MKHTVRCPVCGQELKRPSDLINGKCPDCYIKELTLNLSLPEIKICKYCGAISLENRWIYTETSLESLVIRRITELVKKELRRQKLSSDVYVSIEVPPERTSQEFTIQTTVTLKNFKIPPLSEKVKRETYLIRVSYSVCSRCQKIINRQFEAIIQIRKHGETLTREEREKIKEEVLNVLSRKSNNPSSFISGLTEESSYIEFKVGSNSLARAIASHFKKTHNAQTKITAKLVSMQSGKRVYQLTVLINLPKFSKDSLVVWKNRLGLISAVTDKYIIFTDLTTRQHVTIYLDQMDELTSLDEGAIRKFKIISISRNLVQLMDMHDYTVYDVGIDELPYNFKIDDVVMGVIFNNRIIFLPK